MPPLRPGNAFKEINKNKYLNKNNRGSVTYKLRDIKRSQFTNKPRQYMTRNRRLISDSILENKRTLLLNFFKFLAAMALLLMCPRITDKQTH